MDINKILFKFIEKSPSPFHTVVNIENELHPHGFEKLDEGVRWKIRQGGKYYVSRNGSVIVFTTGTGTSLSGGFRIIGAHADSPSLQIKPNKRNGTGPYLLLGVEKYGGPILSTWLDRELSLAGRVVVKTRDNLLKTCLIDVASPLIYIPNLAIHLNRNVNEGIELNVQEHLSPVAGQHIDNKMPDLESLILETARTTDPDLNIASVSGFDLFCYDINKPSYFGINKELIAAPRLDNLLSCVVGLESIKLAPPHCNTMLIVTNHEEIGSRSESGALGSFASDVFSRLFTNQEDMLISLHNSFLMSLDNAHAGHPSYADSSDPDHKVFLNGGPVIKINANQRYSSTSVTASVIRSLADKADIPVQDFVMRSDMACGSTIGPLTSSQLGISAVDVGAPTWGMHSIREVTGRLDSETLYSLSRCFFSSETLY